MAKRTKGRKKFGKHLLCGFPDYERDKLKSLTYKQKVSYFEFRVKKIFIRPLQKIFNNQIINRQLQNPNCAVMISIVSIMCNVVEAFGHFIIGKIGPYTSHLAFNAFIDKYMDQRLQNNVLNNKSFKWHLWEHFRNGLSHGFIIKQGGIEDQVQKYYETKDYCGIKQLEISHRYLFKDIEEGFYKYLKDLRNNSKGSDISEKFATVFESLFILGK